MLAQGAAQLEFRAFDLSVLEFYRNDPRYHYTTDDIHGSISVRQEHSGLRDSDQVFLQTFGYCYDEDVNRAVAVFLRYLAISEFPKWRKYLISLSFRGQSSVRPVQVGGFDVNIVIHRSTAVRGRGGPARHDAWPPSLGAILAHTDGPCGS